MATTVYACFKCRTTQRDNRAISRVSGQRLGKGRAHRPSGACATCGQAMTVTSDACEVPKKKDNKGWKTYEAKFTR